MLNTLDPDSSSRSRRPPRGPALSLRREYEEYIFQRIEEHKNALSRAELLEVGDEAVRELEANTRDQYLLTEVLLLEHVDRIIGRRLRLPTFQKWSRTHRALRAAQREPTHWGLDADSSLVTWVRRLEHGDTAIVIGASALSAALFIAAHEAEVLLLDQDLGAIESAESRAVSEQLAGRFQALVVQFGRWLPDVPVSLAVIDPAALVVAAAAERRTLVADLQGRTATGGVHVVLPLADVEPEAVIPIAPESLQVHYAGWEIHHRSRSRRAGFAASKPRHINTRANVSE
ncbi:MAG TPA: hypothetical protein VMH88_14560 [Gemmatimonadales bacterium]|nr:hypothetical protein [Gemmatimonadales bacterium]